VAKIAVALRLEPDVLAWLDAYAKGRKVSRQVVLETAVDAFRAECQGGVPDLVDREPVRRAARAPVEDGPAQWMSRRMRSLDEQKARASR
jgi:predicted transcriptional regulator